MPRRVFVTGATGVVGIRAVPLLIGAGNDVTAVGRSPEKRARLESLDARAVELDTFDRTAVKRALEGHDSVINLATYMPPSAFKMILPWQWHENDRIRREGSTKGCPRQFALSKPRRRPRETLSPRTVSTALTR